MRHDSGNADQPRTWLRSARADLAIARIDLPEDATYEQLCFHAQQATEKSIKALLLDLGIDFPYTHNIQLLASLLPTHMQSQAVFTDAVILTPYAVLARYPGELEPVTSDQHATAVRVASAVLEWVTAFVEDTV